MTTTLAELSDYAQRRGPPKEAVLRAIAEARRLNHLDDLERRRKRREMIAAGLLPPKPVRAPRPRVRRTRQRRDPMRWALPLLITGRRPKRREMEGAEK